MLFYMYLGISRLERWNRADKHGLNPSSEVKQLVLAHEGDEKYTQWYRYVVFVILRKSIYMYQCYYIRFWKCEQGNIINLFIKFV